MKVTVSGTRDGVAWPARGGVLEVDDNEGAALCAAGMADPVKDDRVETAVPSKEGVETRQDSDPATESTEPEADELGALRKQAEATGMKVDKRWGADKLRQEIAAANKAKGKE